MVYKFETSLLSLLQREDRYVTQINQFIDKRNVIIDFFNDVQDKEYLEYLHGQYDERLSDLDEDILRYQKKLETVRQEIKDRLA